LNPAISAGLFSTKERGKHFAYADALMTAKGFASSVTQMRTFRKGSWTWHHLKDKYLMVLVRMDVHRSYGHNGGVHIW
ncbi:MAG: HNH endonuclease, partial [Bacteroidota bacterium]